MFFTPRSNKQGFKERIMAASTFFLAILQLMTKSMMLFLITALSLKVPRVSLLVAVSGMLLAVGITVPIILKSHLKLLKKLLAI